MSKTVTVPVEPTEEMIKAGLLVLEGDGVLSSVCEIYDAMLAAAQQEDHRSEADAEAHPPCTGASVQSSDHPTQGESNSNPSPSTGQSKQGLTSSHDGAPTQSDAEMLAARYKYFEQRTRSHER